MIRGARPPPPQHTSAAVTRGSGLSGRRAGSAGQCTSRSSPRRTPRAFPPAEIDVMLSDGAGGGREALRASSAAMPSSMASRSRMHSSKSARACAHTREACSARRRGLSGLGWGARGGALSNGGREWSGAGGSWALPWPRRASPAARGAGRRPPHRSRPRRHHRRHRRRRHHCRLRRLHFRAAWGAVAASRSPERPTEVFGAVGVAAAALPGSALQP